MRKGDGNMVHAWCKKNQNKTIPLKLKFNPVIEAQPFLDVSDYEKLE